MRATISAACKQRHAHAVQRSRNADHCPKRERHRASSLCASVRCRRARSTGLAFMRFERTGGRIVFRQVARRERTRRRCRTRASSLERRARAPFAARRIRDHARAAAAARRERHDVIAHCRQTRRCPTRSRRPMGLLVKERNLTVAADVDADDLIDRHVLRQQEFFERNHDAVVTRHRRVRERIA